MTGVFISAIERIEDGGSGSFYIEELSQAEEADNGYLVTTDDLAMMPIYMGIDDENEGLAVGTENYWAVNSKASQEDIDATLAFLEWVITSDEGRNAITNEMGLTTPFDTFPELRVEAKP